MPARRLRLGAALLAVGLMVAADAASKRWASSELRRRGSRTVVAEHLVLRYQLNSGIAFGLFQESLHPWKGRLLVGYKAVMAAGLAFLLGRRLLREARPGWLVPLGLAGLLAGTLGNLLDRSLRGAVVDFIDLTVLGVLRWPAFNLADAYLALGVVLCAVAIARGLWRARRADADAGRARAR